MFKKKICLGILIKKGICQGTNSVKVKENKYSQNLDNHCDIHDKYSHILEGEKLTLGQI